MTEERQILHPPSKKLKRMIQGTTGWSALLQSLGKPWNKTFRGAFKSI